MKVDFSSATALLHMDAISKLTENYQKLTQKVIESGNIDEQVLAADETLYWGILQMDMLEQVKKRYVEEAILDGRLASNKSTALVYRLVASLSFPELEFMSDSDLSRLRTTKTVEREAGSKLEFRMTERDKSILSLGGLGTLLLLIPSPHSKTVGVLVRCLGGAAVAAATAIAIDEYVNDKTVPFIQTRICMEKITEEVLASEEKILGFFDERKKMLTEILCDWVDETGREIERMYAAEADKDEKDIPD